MGEIEATLRIAAWLRAGLRFMRFFHGIFDHEHRSYGPVCLQIFVFLISYFLPQAQFAVVFGFTALIVVYFPAYVGFLKVDVACL